MLTTMSLMVVWSPLGGQPLKLSSFASTLQPVMCGAMAAYSTRYGHWESDLVKE